MPEVKEILKGNQHAGARMIRLIENNDPSAFEKLKSLYPYAGNAFIIGITGSPGVGKSTLIDALITEFRELDKKVAVIAVDPTSPFSGGAILGDRLRMQRHAADDNVFIRSMASRGHRGGLSRAAKDSVMVLSAMGYGIIIIETVGAGQSEFDIADIAHSTGIVTIPGAGDGIQAVKAGILEVGDIFIVNKSDKPDADASVHQLTMMLEMRKPAEHNDKPDTWQPMVLKTIANNGKGVKNLARAFLSHFDFMEKNNLLAQKKDSMEQSYFNSLLRDFTLERLLFFIKDSEEFGKMAEKIKSGMVDPLSAAETLAGKLLISKGQVSD